MKISVIIPMYNEEKIIKDTVKTVSNYMEAHFGEEDYEVLFVNDGSKDRCAAIVDEMGIPNIGLVSYEENHGKGYAIRMGVQAAEGDVIMFTDCDLAYGLDVVSEFYNALDNTGYDIAVGSRPKHPEGYAGYSLLRKIVSRVYLGVLRVFGGLSLSDSQCGCKAFRKETAKKIFSHCEIDRFAFDFEAILIGQKIGAKFHEIPVKVINHGESKVNIIRDSFKMIRDILKMKKRIKKAQI